MLNPRLLLLAGTLGLFSACQKDKPNPIAPPAPTPLVFHNPIVKDKFTADPSAMVFNGTVYIYTGHDEAPYPQDVYV